MQEITNIENKIRKRVTDIFDELELVIGYGKSNIAGRVNPVFIKKVTDVEKLIFDRFCINNLAVYPYYLTDEFSGTIGLILKPCDARSIAQLLSEGLLKKEKIRAIAVGCTGVIDIRMIQKHITGKKIISLSESSSNINIKTADEEITVKAADFYAEKCCNCNIYDDPPYFDEFIENDEKLIQFTGDIKELLGQLEKEPLKEVLAFWEKEFSRCIRCYACRNICPMEVCRDRCIAQIDSPKWQSDKVNSEEGKFFQLIRVMHLAGRCTECGECERACPANIPLVTLMKKMNREILRLFDYIPGMDIETKPPLLTYKNIEKNIDEEELV